MGSELVRRGAGGALRVAVAALTPFPLVTYHPSWPQDSCAARKSQAASR